MNTSGSTKRAAIAARGSLRVAGGGVIRAQAPVTFTSSYFAIGQPFRAPLHPDEVVLPFEQFPAVPTREYLLPPTFGPGSLRSVDRMDSSPGTVERHQLHLQDVVKADVGGVSLRAGDAFDTAKTVHQSSTCAARSTA